MFHVHANGGWSLLFRGLVILDAYTTVLLHSLH